MPPRPLYIYLLRIKGQGGEFAPLDTYRGHIIVAHSPYEARHMAPVADEGPIWINAKRTYVTQIGIVTHTNITQPTVLMSDFKGG